MRRGLAFALAAVLLLSAPGAAAVGGLPLLGKKPQPTPPTAEPLPEPEPEQDAAFEEPVPGPEPDVGAPELEPHPAAMPPPGGRSSIAEATHRLAPAAALAGLAALVLLVALGVARLANKPRARKPPKRSFEAARAAGWALQPTSLAGAMQALRAPAPAGTVRSAREEGGRVVVAVERSKRDPCRFVQGYLTGIFESAWASDVALAHEHCAGKKGVCWYAVSRSAPTAAAAWTPGSGAAPRRSPPAASAPASRGPRAPRAGSP